jgi:hypothetical protein
VSRQTIWGYSLGGKPGGRKQALPDLHAESGALHVIG